MKFHFVEAAAGLVDIRAEGHIAPDSPEQLTDALVELVGPQIYSRTLRINIFEADFISSAGIGGLLHYNRQFRENGGELVVHAPSRTVR